MNCYPFTGKFSFAQWGIRRIHLVDVHFSSVLAPHRLLPAVTRTSEDEGLPGCCRLSGLFSQYRLGPLVVPFHVARPAKPFDVRWLRVVFVVSVNTAALAALRAGRGTGKAAASYSHIDEAIGSHFFGGRAVGCRDGFVLCSRFAASRTVEPPAAIDFALSDLKRCTTTDATSHGTCTSHRVISGVRFGRASQRATQKFSGFTESNTVVRVTLIYKVGKQSQYL